MLKRYRINVIDNNELEVVLGMHTLKDKDVVRRKVRRVTPHKKYDLTAKNHVRRTSNIFISS